MQYFQTGPYELILLLKKASFIQKSSQELAYWGQQFLVVIAALCIFYNLIEFRKKLKQLQEIKETTSIQEKNEVYETTKLLDISTNIEQETQFLKQQSEEKYLFDEKISATQDLLQKVDSCQTSLREEVARHDLQFLKTFFREQRAIDEKIIEAIFLECENDREATFDCLRDKVYTYQVVQDQQTQSSRVSKRKRADLEKDQTQIHSKKSSEIPAKLPSEKEIIADWLISKFIKIQSFDEARRLMIDTLSIFKQSLPKVQTQNQTFDQELQKLKQENETFKSGIKTLMLKRKEDLSKIQHREAQLDKAQHDCQEKMEQAKQKIKNIKLLEGTCEAQTRQIRILLEENAKLRNLMIVQPQISSFSGFNSCRGDDFTK